ncbi:MAG: type II secretion system protein GspH [Gammaproteobacteria bacterium RIFCSPHIGHO2_12_FULL_37_34]|nr:MAG: type II secretion system protein GspH [Gammaproteobacteria bacterium RIFCSPHIGHO2_12_FULL_37_34]
MKLMRNQFGYTLIEILIVLFIMSIVTGVALLSIRYNENKQLESFANKFVDLVRLAEEQAMLQPNVLGLSIYQHAFQFSHLQLSMDKQQWLPLEDTILHPQVIPDHIQIALEIQGDRISLNENKKPQIIISTNGDITPFTLFFGKKGEKPNYVVIGDADGAVYATTM